MRFTPHFFCIIALGALLSSCSRYRPDVTADLADGASLHFDSALLLSDENYAAQMSERVLPFLEQRRQEGALQTRSGRSVHYETFTAPESRGCIVIFHGFCEFTSKFDELTYYFVKSGYSVCRFDHCGHGLSDRFTGTDTEAELAKVYVDDFATYVQGAKDVVDNIARPLSGGAPLYLFAHSMGGCIGALYIEDYPDDFAAAVLTTPMLTINAGALPQWLATFVADTAVALGKGTDMLLGEKILPETFEWEDTLKGHPKARRSASRPRLEYQFALRRAQPLYRTNAPTFGWTAAAFAASRQARSKESAARVRCPVLLFQAQNDVWVKPAGQEQFCRAVRDSGGSIQMVYCPGIEHEIYNSRTEFLAAYYSSIIGFFEKSAQ